jgi:hypothetical protein
MIIDVTVKVPEERLADFYSMYGSWLEAPGSTSATTDDADDAEPVEWTSTDVDLAKTVWDKFSETAKALFSNLIDAPGREFDGDELAQLANVQKGRHGIAGVLAWPSRHCFAAGRSYCWRWTYPDGETAAYWMPDELADLFRQARDG